MLFVFHLVCLSTPDPLDPLDVRDSAIETSGYTHVAPPSTATLTAAEVARGTPGVALRSLGGVGDFTTLSIRGATSTQVGIYWDGAPLTQPGAGTVDLATLFLLGTGRVVIHRGFAPLTLGPEAFAGALELQSGTPVPGGRASLSYGSFAAREASYAHTLRVGAHTVSLAALYFGKAGDFPYLDDRGTPLVTSDDVDAPRRNNDLYALFLRAEHGSDRYRSEARVLMKQQGAPSPSNNLQDRARYQLVRPQMSATIEREPTRTLHVQANASALATLSRFSDLRPSLYTQATEQSTRELSLRAQTKISWAIRPWLDLDASSDLQGTSFLVGSPGATPQHRGRFLAGGAVVARARFFDERLELEAGSRLDGLYDGGVTSPSVLQPSDRVIIDRARVFVQPSAGLRFAPVRLLSFGAHIGRRERAPTFYELFGTDGQIRGNPLLEPEAQWSWDVGARLDHRFVSAEIVYAESRYERLITMIYAGLDLPRAENIGRATSRSLEVSASTTPSPHFSARASYTFQPTRNDTPGAEYGRALAGRPRHQAKAEIAGWLPQLRASISALTVAGLFLDSTATREVPVRLSLDAEIAWRPGNGPVSLQVTVRNLLDQTSSIQQLGAASAPVPIVDFLGFPLPGRSFSFSLIYAFGAKGDVSCSVVHC